MESSVMAVIRASRPKFRGWHDEIAFAVHASFLAAGYSLIATGRAALADDPPLDGEEVGFEGWNELEDSYGFVYSKSEKVSKKVVLVKCLPIGDTLNVDVIDLMQQQQEPLHLQINVKDHLTEVSGRTSNYRELYKDLQGLVKSLDSSILSKLEAKPKVSSSTRGGERAGHGIINEPVVGIPIENQPRPSGLIFPPVPSTEINDLYPGPGAGFYPERGSGMGGGMLVGPHDPRWRSGEPPLFGDGIPGVLPGTRFDPYGPPDVPGFEPSRFVRNPRGRGGGAHPDLQHFPGPEYM